MTLVFLSPHLLGDGSGPVVGVGLGDQFALAAVSPEVAAVEEKVHVVGLILVADILDELAA